ncbi:hypothetical protein, partial [Streptomyces sp. NPDC058741]|uniref:hypothetical protein n=1 Tax=Streptomyces sp. NPDC058741 TaxID=3346620 RepID=UPI0036CF1F3A
QEGVQVLRHNMILNALSSCPRTSPDIGLTRLEQTAHLGATTSWSRMRKRFPALPRLHRDDESVVLWLVDEERQDGEPLLSALVTVGDRQMHPRFPVIAEQLGLPCPGTPTQQQMIWSYEVLKVHQYWRHRPPQPRA